jgi:hypothetical protein
MMSLISQAMLERDIAFWRKGEVDYLKGRKALNSEGLCFYVKGRVRNLGGVAELRATRRMGQLSGIIGGSRSAGKYWWGSSDTFNYWRAERAMACGLIAEVLEAQL